MLGIHRTSYDSTRIPVGFYQENRHGREAAQAGGLSRSERDDRHILLAHWAAVAPRWRKPRGTAGALKPAPASLEEVLGSPRKS